jgi:BirA family biotin operon repressor/biotin-[acetyl-CoA-carboxylase] ligase
MPGQQIILLDKVESTNLHALDNFDRLPHMAAIFADSQTGGRGRQGRKWLSPLGNIYASFILKRLPWPAPCAAFATCLAGLSTLAKFAPGREFRIKLPNDIVCENRKIGGVLCEIHKSASATGVVAGIGLNINAGADELDRTGTDAASILTLTGRESDLVSVRLELVNNVLRFSGLGEEEIISEFIANCMMVGRQIAVKDAFGELRGELKRVMSDGAAVVETADGTRRKFYSGDFAVL